MSDNSKQPQTTANGAVELEEAKLDQASGGSYSFGATSSIIQKSKISDGTSNISDGTSNIVDGTSNTRR